MKHKLLRLTAALCALCMLMISMPALSRSDTLPATPTDLLPAADPASEEEGSGPEGTEPADVQPEKPAADKEVTFRDEATVSGEIKGKMPADYLIRFTPEYSRRLQLTLEADNEVTATVTDEETGSRTVFIPGEPDEDGRSTWQLTEYRTNGGRSYLVRISAEHEARFTLKIKKKTAADNSDPAEAENETPAEPVNETPEVPEKEAPAEPENGTPTEPENETPEAPENEAPAEPENGTPTAPENETPEAAENEAPAEPENGTPAEPENETPEAAENEAPAEPESGTSAEPENGIRTEPKTEITEQPENESPAITAEAPAANQAGTPAQKKESRPVSGRNQASAEMKEPATPTDLLPEGMEQQGPEAEPDEPDEPGVLAALDFGPVTVELLGYAAGGEAILNETEYPEAEEGLEVLGCFRAEQPAGDGRLWIRTRMWEDAWPEPEGSIMLYRVADGKADPAAACPAGDGMIMETDGRETAVIRDTGYRRMTLTVYPEGNTEGQTITLTGMMPKETDAEAEDVTESFDGHEYRETLPAPEPAELRAAPKMMMKAKGPAAEPEKAAGPEPAEEQEEGEPEPVRTTLAVFSIQMTDGGMEYQPGEERPVLVEIRDSRITADREIELWHIRDDGTEEQVAEFTREEGIIAFLATGFSAYAIVAVDFPVLEETGWQKVADIGQLAALGEAGLYVSSIEPSGNANNHTYFFWKNEFIDKCGNNNNTRHGIGRTTPRTVSPDTAEGAGVFRFEKDGDTGRYFISCTVGGETKYLRTDGNQIYPAGTDDRTSYTVEHGGNGWFAFKAGNGYYINLTSDENGKGFAAWNQNNQSSKMYLWRYVSIEEEPYGLQGKTFGLMNWNGGVAGKALMAASPAAGTLEAKALPVLVKSDDHTDRLFVPNDGDISMWTFRWIREDLYRLSAETGSGIKYLAGDGNGFFITDDGTAEATEIQVVPGAGDRAGQLCLRAGSRTLTYSGNVETGFSTGGSVGSEWLYPVEYSDLTADYFLTYSASKISVSDRSLTNGSRIIVYTRSWNEARKRYDYYAVSHDGTLVPCYESGDSIEWIGNRINTLLWNLVEYYKEGTNEPNYYYELYNEYSERYIAPQMTGNQVLSPNTIGINLDGRKRGRYYTSIVAWDDREYAYAGLKAEGGTVEICPIREAGDFYFAVMQDVNVDDGMTTVPTVDHIQRGITMKIKDFSTRKEMSNFLGNDAGGAVTTLQSGLLSSKLGPDGYPTAAGGSLKNLIGGGREVNHLFIASTYNGTGYYTFDSTQNFASLQADNNFKVYKEIGSYDSGGNKPSLKHGQFFPFNDLEPGVFTSVNRQNLYSATVSPLPETDPRKYENLYLVKNANCYFSMELEASFVQTPSGQDAWGHDIIYEFTGDDDFWLYVDGELVIDLGGIHSAVPGNVNFCTGEVYINGRHTTLKELFYENCRKREGEEAAQAYVDALFVQNEQGQWIFPDYTTHTMRIFYMERGGGASNLNMRFNLASVQPGHVELSKELTGVEDPESMQLKYPFQIWYRETPDAPEKRLNEVPGIDIRVFYKDTITPVEYRETYTVDGITYPDVFMLRPGETADINVPDDAIYYRIAECGINTDVYRNVTVNEGKETSLAAERKDGYPDNRADYGIAYAKTSERPRAAFTNEMDPEALRTLTIRKVLYDETGENIIEDDNASFSFRLYFSMETEAEFTLADKYLYHVKNKNGEYCRWDSAAQKLVSLGGGKTDYESLTAEERKAASFFTSINGAISRIPASYTVEVREVPVGTRFEVEERSYEIPDGYSLQKYQLFMAGTNGAMEEQTLTGGPSDPAEGSMEKKDAEVRICNLKGYGLRLYKTWNDDDYMAERDPVYFAVFITNPADGTETLAAGTVRQMPRDEETCYWYFERLNGIPFDNYVIYEVTVENPVTDAEGNVTSHGAVTPVPHGGTVTVGGRQKGETTASPQAYTVKYTRGGVSEGSNVRVDYVENSRPGIVLKKANWTGDIPLAGAEFTLLDAEYDANNPEKAGLLNLKLKSGTDGFLTKAFLRNSAEYILTETQAPVGYHAMEAPVVIRTDNTGEITVSGTEAGGYTLTEEAGEKTLTIRNKQYSFVVRKQDSATGYFLAGAHFSLHRQRTVGGVTLVDFTPMSGYEDMVSGADGVIPGLDQTLAPGTYELRETKAPTGYTVLPAGIRFTLSGLGTIELLQAPEGAALDKQEIEENGRIRVIYTLRIANSADTKWPWLRISKQAQGGVYDPSRQYTFTVTMEGIEDGRTFSCSGSRTGTVTFMNGQAEVSLAHGENIMLEKLPLDIHITVAEETGSYTTAWEVGGSPAEPDGNNAVSMVLTDNIDVRAINELPYIAPTGISRREMPFLLMLGTGGILLGLAYAGRHRRRERIRIRRNTKEE